MPAQSKAGRWKKKADQRARACEIVERSQKFWPLDKRPGDDGDDGNGGGEVVVVRGGEGGGTGRTGQGLLATATYVCTEYSVLPYVLYSVLCTLYAYSVIEIEIEIERATSHTIHNFETHQAHTSAVRIGGPANSAEDMDDEYE